MSSGKLLLGVLAGIAAGAVAGILLAPDKGSETRKRISRKSDDYVDGLKDKFNDFLDNINTNYDSVKEKVSEFSKDGHATPAEGTKAK